MFFEGFCKGLFSGIHILWQPRGPALRVHNVLTEKDIFDEVFLAEVVLYPQSTVERLGYYSSPNAGRSKSMCKHGGAKPFQLPGSNLGNFPSCNLLWKRYS